MINEPKKKTYLGAVDGGPPTQPPSISSSESLSAIGSGRAGVGSSGASANISPSKRPAAGSGSVIDLLVNDFL